MKNSTSSTNSLNEPPKIQSVKNVHETFEVNNLKIMLKIF